VLKLKVPLNAIAYSKFKCWRILAGKNHRKRFD